jgi:hypothetical protein
LEKIKSFSIKLQQQGRGKCNPPSEMKRGFASLDPAQAGFP